MMPKQTQRPDMDIEISSPEYFLRQKWGRRLPRGENGEPMDRERHISFMDMKSEEIDEEVLDEIYEQYKQGLVLDDVEDDFYSFSRRELMEIPVRHPMSMDFFAHLEPEEQEDLLDEYMKSSSLRFAWLGYEAFRSTIMN